KKFNYFDCTPASTPLDTCEKLMPNRGLALSQLEYFRVISCLMYAMTYTRPDIAFVVRKLMLEGYTDASWISNTKDNSSTSGWVFLLGGGAISWASKKQTCIAGSTMKYEFVAPAAAGKEAEWNYTKLESRDLFIPISGDGGTECTPRGRIVGNLVQLQVSVHTGIWGWRYEVYTQRSLNTLTQIVVEVILVADDLQ
nr:hypothetical protein [Tanacetum cinerariifolium]